MKKLTKSVIICLIVAIVITAAAIGTVLVVHKIQSRHTETTDETVSASVDGGEAAEEDADGEMDGILSALNSETAADSQEETDASEELPSNADAPAQTESAEAAQPATVPTTKQSAAAAKTPDPTKPSTAAKPAAAAKAAATKAPTTKAAAKPKTTVPSASTAQKPTAAQPAAQTAAQSTTAAKKVTLSSIRLASYPTKKSYYLDESFDKSGTKVEAVYSDGSSKDVTDKCTFTTKPFNTRGDYTVTVSYSESGDKKTLDFSVSVNEYTLKLDHTSLQIFKGGSQQLTATTTPANKSVQWSSSDDSIVTVSGGKVSGKNVGTAVVTATIGTGANKKTSTCSVTVKKVEVTAVTVTPAQKTIKVGESFTLTWAITPNNAERDDRKTSWSSADKSIATVTVKDGTVTVKGIKAGSTTISAKVPNGKYGTCVVTVSDTAITGVSVNPTSKTVSEGEKFDITATISPSNASNKTLTWTSSDTGVATVKTNGTKATITAVKEGNAKITATSVNGKQAVCTVTVKGTTISVNPTSKTISEGESFSVAATVSPSNASNKTITWTSSDTGVAAVKADGTKATVTGVKGGKATITAALANGKKAVCTVTVKGATVSVSPTSKTISVGETLKLTATISPSSASGQIIAWTSSNNSVATVSASGNGTTATVTGVKESSNAVTITATLSNGNKAACKVTVKGAPLSSIKVASKPKKLTYTIGDTLNASGMSVTATYSSGAQKTVTSSCKLSPTSLTTAGTQTITVSYTENGTTKTDSFTVTVIEFIPPERSHTITSKPSSITVRTEGFPQKGSTYYVPYNMTWGQISNEKGLVLATLSYKKETYQIPYTVTPANATVTFTCSQGSAGCITVTNTGLVSFSPPDGYDEKQYSADIQVKVSYNGTVCFSDTYKLNAVADNCGFRASFPNCASPVNFSYTSNGEASYYVRGEETGTGSISFNTTNGLSKSISVRCFMIGDANNDNKVGIQDTVKITRYMEGLESSITGYRADADMDGKIDVNDITAISKYTAGVSSLPNGTASSAYFSAWFDSY